MRKMGKKFGKEIGTELCSRKMKDLKKNVDCIRKKMNFVIVVVICFWVFFFFWV